jgi:hypothetical protein
MDVSTQKARLALKHSFAQWVAIILLVGWVAYLQYDARQYRNANEVSVNDRLKTVEASTQVIEESLKINCNGNDSFTLLHVNGPNNLNSRQCLVPNATTALLHERFDNVSIVGNTTAFNRSAVEFFEFSGGEIAPGWAPRYYLAADVSMLCGRMTLRVPPEDAPFCIVLSNMRCGFGNLLWATIPVPDYGSLIIDAELRFSPEACSLLPSSV